MIVINVKIFNNTGMELTLDAISRTTNAQWTKGVDDVGQTIAAHGGLEATLEGPNNQAFNAELRWQYPKALGVSGDFSTQVCKTLANGAPAWVMALTDETTPDTVRVDAASYLADDRSWEVGFIVNVPPPPV